MRHGSTGASTSRGATISKRCWTTTPATSALISSCRSTPVLASTTANLSYPAGTIAPVPPFKVVSDFAPGGDQPRAVAQLAEGVNRGDRFQTLLGITASGKSATIAWTIEQLQRPPLVLAPNKSLAAQ